MTVSAWAIENMGYDPDVLPYQMEVMDALGEGGDVDLMGPAQNGKSEIGLAWWGWSIDHSPADFIICQPDKVMMQDFVERRLEKLVERVPALKAAMLPGASSDNIFMKKFVGMISSHIWPVASQFRARPVPRGWLDDYDQIPEDIEGQGDAHSLMGGRQTWFEGRRTTFSSSSPAAGTALISEGGGIEARVLGGTDERLAPACPECGERFVIDIAKHLHFNRNGNGDDAAASAHVVCPTNGCILPPARLKLIASTRHLPDRGWLPMNPGARRRSFAVDGLMNVTSWADLARQWREAELAWESRQDEAPLRSFFNTKGGKNYRSRTAGEKALTADDLAPRIERGWRLGTVPPGVDVLVAAVDVQQNRFEVAIWGFGAGMEMWLVDRFDLHVLDDGVTLIDPATCPEHWAILTSKVLQRRWPLAESPDITMPVITTAVDVHGEKGVTPNAAAWARSVFALGVPKDRITLVRGGPHTQQWPTQKGYTDTRKSGVGKDRRRGVALWNVNTRMLKHIVFNRLLRSVPGAGYIHWPEGTERRWLEEITAEEFRGGKWVQMRPRNETLDLAVYASAALMRPPYAQTRHDMNWVPKEFRRPLATLAVAAPTSEQAAGREPAAVVPIATAPAAAARAPQTLPPPPPSMRGRVNPFTGRSGGLLARR